MAKRRRRTKVRRKEPAPTPETGSRLLAGRGSGGLKGTLDALLHSQPISGGTWKYFPAVLALAFAVRAAVALSGDFVLHPDEIMQYLEPAHRLVFGNGIIFWEYFYGARAWFVPGFVAGILKLFDLLGLAQPQWYIAGVKLAFCAVSLAIPAGMYFFARRHFGEATARVALLAGAFWYELVAFAHKPMTEFVATALLMSLLALCARPSPHGARIVWGVACLAVLTAAIRLQYAPLALLLLGIAFFRTGKKALLVCAAALFFFATGVFDGLTWDGRLFHSYLANIHVNLSLGELLAEQSPSRYLSPPHQFLVWLLSASLGLSALCIAGALREPRRYGFLLVLIVLIVFMHSLQTHKEYRFIFAVIPLWLLVGADVLVRAAAGSGKPVIPGILAVLLYVAVSAAGILNALPYQNRLYGGLRAEAPGFIRNQDPVFAAYRYLAGNPEAVAIAQLDRYYAYLPGYYYLHRKIPLYALNTANLIADVDPETFSTNAMVNLDVETLPTLVSHVVSSDPQLVIPGYSVEKEFGNIRIWSREQHEWPVRQWQNHTPAPPGMYAQIYRHLYPDAPTMPANAGIRFVEEPQ